jgi:hypothetical protein
MIIGQFARLLLTVVMVAVSQAPSPESNPNSPLPVNGKVVNYTTFNLIGGKFIQHRTERCFRNIRLPQQSQLPLRALVFVPANCTPHNISRFPARCLESVRFVLQVLAIHFEIVIPSEMHKALLRWVDNKPFNEPYTDLSRKRKYSEICMA